MRGLTIDGPGTGFFSSGILFTAGGNLAIENCVIRGFPIAGITIAPSTSSSFSVSNTIASNNVFDGIDVRGNGLPITGVLSNVTANNNKVSGISVSAPEGSPNVTIVDSEASNNGNVGIVVQFTTPAVMVRNVVASNNKTGLEADMTAILRVAHSVVTGNATGVNTTFGGIINSYGDNDIDGNTSNNTGVLKSLATH